MLRLARRIRVTRRIWDPLGYQILLRGQILHAILRADTSGLNKRNKRGACHARTGTHS